MIFNNFSLTWCENPLMWIRQWTSWSGRWKEVSCELKDLLDDSHQWFWYYFSVLHLKNGHIFWLQTLIEVIQKSLEKENVNFFLHYFFLVLFLLVSDLNLKLMLLHSLKRTQFHYISISILTCFSTIELVNNLQ